MALYTEDEINIKAPIAKVWDALTNPSLTPHYMFGCEVITDWKPGSEVLWKGLADGVIYVKGILVSLKKEQELSFTIFDPMANYEDIPSNHLIATYTLTDMGESTLLHVKQGDYSTVAEGTKRYEDTIAQGGWSAVLGLIKSLFEKK